MTAHGRALHGACTIGIDLDNTIICYDAALAAGAAALGVVIPEACRGKRAIRDFIRLLPDGENVWMRLQAHIYGPGIGHATLMEGVRDFLEMCRARGAAVFVVSHKTRYAAAAPEGPDLREAVMAFLEQQGLFRPDSGLTPERVFFESSRADKLRRIATLGCTHFIDDLAETFLEPEFPADVVRILLDRDGPGALNKRWTYMASWEAVRAHFMESCWNG